MKYTLKNGTVKEYNKTEYNKKYIDSHKLKLNQRFVCDCGGKYTYTNKDKHIKTKRHREYLGESVEIGTPGRVSTKSIICDCGGKYTKNYLKKHQKTERHKKYIASKNQQTI